MAPSFWGGEPELLVLSKMLRVPITVYLSSQDAGRWVLLHASARVRAWGWGEPDAARACVMGDLGRCFLLQLCYVRATTRLQVCCTACWRVGQYHNASAPPPTTWPRVAPCRRDRGYMPIQRYGEDLRSKGGKKRKGVRLLYTGGNHYDLLLK